ncbi:hypothetical protein BDZ89DRAFT_1131011 [Hymenopellis radicata]|nr:hypothetical protein BDZ89DRAFT_1131011 [Hymenopellis radicata]
MACEHDGKTDNTELEIQDDPFPSGMATSTYDDTPVKHEMRPADYDSETHFSRTIGFDNGHHDHHDCNEQHFQRPA